MKMMQLALIFFVVFSSSLLQGAESTGRIVAFAQDNMKNDFRKAQVFKVRDALIGHPEISFVYSDAEGQMSLMIRQINQFIEQKVDLLIIGTGDADSVVPVVTRAYKEGIPVIILDRGVNTDNYTTFINSDNIEIGATGARYIAEKLQGKGLVLLFEGLQAADVTQLRSKGFLDIMQRYPDIKVIRRTGNYLRKDALLEMEKLVDEGIKVDAIFSESDSMLSGVRMVLKKNNIPASSIIMIGCDYTSEAREAIRNGTQTGTVYFSLGSKKSAATALKIFAGKKVPKHIVIPTQLVTRENVEQVEPIF